MLTHLRCHLFGSLFFLFGLSPWGDDQGREKNLRSRMLESLWGGPCPFLSVDSTMCYVHEWSNRWAVQLYSISFVADLDLCRVNRRYCRSIVAQKFSDWYSWIYMSVCKMQLSLVPPLGFCGAAYFLCPVRLAFLARRNGLISYLTLFGSREVLGVHSIVSWLFSWGEKYLRNHSYFHFILLLLN